MSKNDVIKIYNSKLKDLLKHNKLYYQDSAPIISDNYYDKLKTEIIELEKKHKFLKNTIKLLYHQAQVILIKLVIVLKS